MVLQRLSYVLPKKKRNKKETPALSNCCKVGYWFAMSVVSLQCLERIQVMAEHKNKNNHYVRTSFNFVRQGSTNCTEQIEPCSASKIGLDTELHGECCIQCLPKSISLQLWQPCIQTQLESMHPTQRFDVYMKGRFRGKSLLGEGPLLAMYKSSTCICLPNSHQAPTYIPYPLTYHAHPLT
jgi:hypothetical protein